MINHIFSLQIKYTLIEIPLSTKMIEGFFINSQNKKINCCFYATGVL